MRLAGKTAIVTGAASGIGEATARLFAEHGARLVVVDQNGARLDEVTASLRETATVDITACVGDVADRNTADRAVAMASAGGGHVDILFNNAGIMGSNDLLEFGEEDWDRMLAVNVRSMYLMARAVLPGMLEHRSGSIVNTSSVMAFLTEPGHEAYTTSKAAIVGFTKSMAVSYAASGVRSNCVCPGWVDTPMNRELGNEAGGMDKLNAIVRQQQPLGRMVSPREVAQAVLFLASDDASGVTGVALNVDGAAGSSI
jgi:dihydroanticapsin dehydrogenase